jgi:hypothetical protein
MKQTAVEFLSEKYMYVTWLRNRDEISAEQADKMREQYLEEAKALLRYQISMAHLDGATKMFFKEYKSAEQYYNETYK